MNISRTKWAKGAEIGPVRMPKAQEPLHFWSWDNSHSASPHLMTLKRGVWRERGLRLRWGGVLVVRPVRQQHREVVPLVVLQRFFLLLLVKGTYTQGYTGFGKKVFPRLREAAGKARQKW